MYLFDLSIYNVYIFRSINVCINIFGSININIYFFDKSIYHSTTLMFNYIYVYLDKSFNQHNYLFRINQLPQKNWRG